MMTELLYLWTLVLNLNHKCSSSFKWLVKYNSLVLLSGFVCKYQSAIAVMNMSELDWQISRRNHTRHTCENMNRLINMPCSSTLVTGMGWAKTLKLQQYSMITACTWHEHLRVANSPTAHMQNVLDLSSSRIHIHKPTVSFWFSDSESLCFTDEGDSAVLRSDYSFIATRLCSASFIGSSLTFIFTWQKGISNSRLSFNIQFIFTNKTSWEQLYDKCYKAGMSTTTSRPIKVLKIPIRTESHTINLNNWLSNTSLFYKSMWIWDQRTIRSAKITIQWAINSGWTHSVAAKPLLFSHWWRIKHITEHFKLRKPKLTWQSHVWISLEGLLGGKAGPLLVQALHRLLRRGRCCPVDREYVSTLWVRQKSYGNSLAHAVQKSLHPKFSPVS